MKNKLIALCIVIPLSLTLTGCVISVGGDEDGYTTTSLRICHTSKHMLIIRAPEGPQRCWCWGPSSRLDARWETESICWNLELFELSATSWRNSFASCVLLHTSWHIREAKTPQSAHTACQYASRPRGVLGPTSSSSTFWPNLTLVEQNWTTG